MRITPTTGTTGQATGSRLPNYGRDPRKLRARPLQTTGATLANYGRDPVKLRAPAGPRRRNASFSEFLARLMIAASFRFLEQKKYTQNVNLIVLKGSHCNLPCHPNSILTSNCHPTASLSAMTWQAGRKKIMGLRIEKKP
jgi:hypothetical protein